jgi:hypothetical protein
MRVGANFIFQFLNRTAEGKKSPIRIVGSTLKIKKLEFLDKGFYTCEVLGGNGQKISSTGILDVIHDAGIRLRVELFKYLVHQSKIGVYLLISNTKLG